MHNVQTLKQFKAVVVDTDVQVTQASIQTARYFLESHGVAVDPVIFAALPNIGQIIEQLYAINVDAANSTFYKTLEEMSSLSDAELILNQILHYLTSPSTNVLLDGSSLAYEPNELVKTYEPFIRGLVTIKAITVEELEQKILSLLTSGIALSTSTISDVISLIKHYGFDINFNLVKNRDAQAILSARAGFALKDVDQFMKTLIYALTGATSYVKSQRFFKTLEYNRLTDERLNLVTDLFTDYSTRYGLDEFAKHSNRHRKTLLVVKKHLQQADPTFAITAINTITRRAKSLAVAAKLPDLMRFTSGELTLDQQAQAISNMTVYQLTRLYNAVNLRLTQLSLGEEYVRVFKIRNGLSYVKTSKDDAKYAKLLSAKLTETLQLIETQLVDLVHDKFKGKTIVIPENVHYAVPQTAKAFSDTLPEFTYFDMPSTFGLGVYWETQGDIDLSATADGVHVSWHSGLRNESIRHSGDMTRLNQHGFAAEFIEVSNMKSSVSLNASLYSDYSDQGSKKFKVLAVDKFADTDKMIDKSSIVFAINREFDGYGNVSLGLAIPSENGARYVVTTANANPGRVTDPTLVNLIRQATSLEVSTRLTFDKLIDKLNAAGADVTVVRSLEGLDDVEDVIDLSLESLTQEKFVSLLSDEA